MHSDKPLVQLLAYISEVKTRLRQRCINGVWTIADMCGCLRLPVFELRRTEQNMIVDRDRKCLEVVDDEGTLSCWNGDGISSLTNKNVANVYHSNEIQITIICHFILYIRDVECLIGFFCHIAGIHRN